ncbi:hypothetical protein FOZ63_010394 [Perkinsus olseni]|uniref:Uncharacterized protein n=1 Tax=Perkinsus olseni TaxID=32597 RepID=A0A7J6QJC6_PEROL|nr:hypothetical protein FOZ63_010394 [Perkinsus olseni]
MQARPADVPTMSASARFAARPADFQRRPLPPTSPRGVRSTELPRAVSLTPRAEEVVATPTSRPDAEAPAPRQLQQLPDYVGEHWAPPNVMLPRDGGRLTVRLPQVLSSGEVRPEMVQAELELSNVGQPHRFHDRVAITAIMAMWVPVDPQSGLAVVPREQQPALPVLRPAPAALQLEDVLDAISAVGPVDTSVDLHEFDAQSLVNTEAEVDIINESLSYLPRSEDLDGVLPPIRPVDQNAFDWDIDSTIEKAGIRHPGWTRPWPFRPVPFVPWRMVALRCDPTSRRGDMEYLTSAPFAVTREDVLSGDWGEFWQGFDDGHGCNGFLNNAFVAFEHPLVAGVLPSFDEDCSARLLFLSELGEGPKRNKDSRGFIRPRLVLWL